MTDLELIEKHMAERFATPDPFVRKRIELLQVEVEFLSHRVMCLQAENRGLRGIIELLRGEQEGVRDHPGSHQFASKEYAHEKALAINQIDAQASLPSVPSGGEHGGGATLQAVRE